MAKAMLPMNVALREVGSEARSGEARSTVIPSAAREPFEVIVRL
jgi:hypothetical protein